MSLSEITPRRNPLLEYGFSGQHPKAEQRLTDIMVQGEVAALRKVKTIYGEDLMSYIFGMHSSHEFLDMFTDVQNDRMTLDKTALVKMAIGIDFFHTIREFADPKHSIRFARTMARSLVQARGNTGVAIARALKHADPMELASIHHAAEDFARDL